MQRGSVIPVDLAAEGLAPRGVVEADVAVERHPVLDLGVVALAAQRRVARLVGQAVDPFGVAWPRVGLPETK